MNDPTMPDWRSIDAYLAGEASDAEREAVQQWIAERPANAAIIEQMRAALSPIPRHEVNVDTAWASVQKRAATAPRPPRSVSARWAWPAAIAAGVLIIVFGASRIALQRGPELVIAAAPGQRIVKTLNDGSTVTLNGESRLVYREDGKGRHVQLQGEAAFHVTHDATRPFEVKSGGATITDLGTQFAVHAYPESERVDVAVTEGRVSLRRTTSPTDSIVLVAGAVGHVSAAGVAADSSSSAAHLVAWLDGSLVFDNAALGDVARALHRRYGVAIRMADSALVARRITTTIREDSVAQALDAIGMALGIAYERRADTIVLRVRR